MLEGNGDELLDLFRRESQGFRLNLDDDRLEFGERVGRSIEYLRHTKDHQAGSCGDQQASKPDAACDDRLHDASPFWWWLLVAHIGFADDSWARADGPAVGRVESGVADGVGEWTSGGRQRPARWHRRDPVPFSPCVAVVRVSGGQGRVSNPTRIMIQSMVPPMPTEIWSRHAASTATIHDDARRTEGVFSLRTVSDPQAVAGPGRNDRAGTRHGS